MIESYVEKKANPKWQKEIDLTRKAIEKAQQMQTKPKFFVVCGDLVDAFPNTPLNQPQVDDFKKVFAELKSDIPLICVCGNHDVGNTPTPETVDLYRQRFGDDYFVFWYDGVMFIVLNSQYYEDRSQTKEIAEKQDQWLDDVLKQAHKYRHVIVFQHIPWFLQKADEENDYFNIEKDLRIKMLDKFEKAGVKAIFCGHYHQNAGGKYKDMEVVVTSAIGAQLGNEKSGFRIVKVLANKIEHTYYELDSVPKCVNF
ncbi:purple acid phosphatase-like protein [Dinothrombium tinctorium]|uniref:Serine/threonine-protein phosphatase CPPED1 n=1 Tax=Dinothrombium tinctorium TaxID=1965070 RepID=A0A443RKW6_9ACAR|nr:purple acid phosphatase-like protein [Dinothrombium tinctorium]